jgi:hypothetical protein
MGSGANLSGRSRPELVGLGYGAALALLPMLIGWQGGGGWGFSALVVSSAPWSILAFFFFPLFAAPVWWSLVFWLAPRAANRDPRQYFVVAMTAHYVASVVMLLEARDMDFANLSSHGTAAVGVGAWIVVYGVGQRHIWRQWIRQRSA